MSRMAQKEFIEWIALYRREHDEREKAKQKGKGKGRWGNRL